MLVDIIIIVCLICAIGYGIKKGCIKVVSKIVTIAVAFALAYILAKTTGKWLSRSNGLGETVRVSIEDSLAGYNVGNGQISEDTTNFISKLQQVLGTNFSNDKANIVNRMTDYVFTGLGFVLVYIVVRIILQLATKLLDGVFELPILKTFNKLGGALVAIILALIEISVILAIINLMSSFEFMRGIINLINSSIIGSELYSHNIITNIIVSKIL